MVENLPSKAGDLGSISGQETKIPHAKLQQLSPHATNRETMGHNEKIPRDAMKILCKNTSACETTPSVHFLKVGRRPQTYKKAN